MIYVKPTLAVMLLLAFIAALHYYVPQRSIVRVTGTEVIRVDYETTDAQGNTVVRTRDVRQIKGTDTDGDPRVFNNEDATLYFKFDSADLDARAHEQISTVDNPRWSVVTHYGWRVQVFSWFPNAISLRKATGPDEELTYWRHIAIISGIVLLLLIIRRVILLLINRYVDPVLQSVDEEIDAHTNAIGRFFRRIRRFISG